jgi:hypothetical protein
VFRRKDGKYLIYLAKTLAEDSMFPFPLSDVREVYVLVSFEIGKRVLIVEPIREPDSEKDGGE